MAFRIAASLLSCHVPGMCQAASAAHNKLSKHSERECRRLINKPRPWHVSGCKRCTAVLPRHSGHDRSRPVNKLFLWPLSGCMTAFSFNP